MWTRYDNDSASMKPPTNQRNAILNPSYSVRTLRPQSSQLDISRLTTPLFQKGAGNRFDKPGFVEQLPYSPVSLRSGSSFSSQGSSVDPWELVSSEPSSPRTPKSKHELDDGPRLDLIPPSRDFLKRKCDSPDEYAERTKLPAVKLPSVYCLLPATDNDEQNAAVRPIARTHLQTPCASPEPNHSSHIIPAKPASPPSDDPIIQWLNLRRQESGATKGALPQPEGLSFNINLDSHPAPPTFYREKQSYTHQPRGSFYPRPQRRPQQQQPSPPRDGVKKARAKSKNKVHCNIKYSLEELDYIRFNKYEMKRPWEECRCLFRQKFPMAEAQMNRGIDGIQSVHYRNNANVPRLVGAGRVLVFMPNGHVEPVNAKVRGQRENKPYFSLTYLYPERALLYDWVPAEVKAIAAELANERKLQKEQARREAIRRKKWAEKLEPGACACCVKSDRVRDTQKRAVPQQQQQQQSSNFAAMPPVSVKPEPEEDQMVRAML